MENKKLIKNIILGLTCLVVAALIVFSLYQHRKYNEISRGMNMESPPTIDESTGNASSQSIDIAGKYPGENIPSPSVQTTRTVTGEIEDLEAQLNATEAELDEANQQLADEAARKEALKEKQLELQKQYASDPSFKSYMRASLDTQLADLFKELNLSPEELEKFKDLYIDRTMALTEIYPEISSATTKEQKADLQKRMAEIREEYETKIKEALGSKYDTYYDYTEMATTRSVINSFKASLSPDDQLTEEQEKELTKIMYKEQMQVFEEIGYDPRKEPEFQSDVKSGEVDGQVKNMEKIHTRSIANSKGVLTASQLEQYEEYLNNQREMMELASKLSD